MSGGSPFQTFYLMFKSNAKDAKKDVTDLDKSIAEMAAKGKNRTADETKQLNELRKQRREASSDLKDQQKVAEETGSAFTNMAEAAMKAAAAYISFQAFKSGIVNAQEFNRTLTIQTKLWGQNANEINAYGSAVKSAGGDIQGFFGWYDKIRQQNAAQGRGTLPLGQLMGHIRNQVKGLPPEAAQMIFQQYGLGDAGAQSLLSGSDEDYAKAIAAAVELTNNTNAGSKASQEFGRSWDNLGKGLEKFWTTVNTVILPPLSALIDGITTLFNSLANNKAGATMFFLAMAASATAFTAAIPAILAGFTAISAGALAAAVPLAIFLAKFAAIAAIAAAIPGGAYGAGEGIGHWINRRLGRGDSNGILPGKEGYQGGGSAGSGSAMDYLMTKHGLSAHHAAAVVANLNSESSGDTSAIGDGGKARGAFQWHPDRQRNIRNGTGIDVTAGGSLYSHLDAMMWEMKSRGQMDNFLNTKSAYDAGYYFSHDYEVANGKYGRVAEAMTRGRAAMDIAATTPFASMSPSGGGSQSVSIGKIDVNTQATDAAGIARDLKGALQKEISNVYSQNNDALAY